MLTMDISRALDIEGWMVPQELEWLAEQAKTHRRIVELGSFCGRSTRALGDNTEGWVLAFDDWAGPRDAIVNQLVDEMGNVLEDKPISMDQLCGKWGVSLIDTFTTNCADLIEAGKVRLLQGDHGDLNIIPSRFLEGCDYEKPDMVFIDGDHSYESALRDIQTWLPRLAKGGLLCGHDAGWDGVFKALVECFGGKWSTPPLTDIWVMNA
jgi:methyltransferase family protein